MRLRHRPRPFAAPVGTHHRIPADQTFTRPQSTVKDPQDPPQVVVVPTWSAATIAPLPTRDPGTNWPPPGADPAPVVTEVVFDPAVSRALRQDYAELPVFRAAARDRQKAGQPMFAGLQLRKPTAPPRGNLP